MQKGIVLAGGKGTRLYPLTKNISKQLLPIYDKPMIYYSLSTLMLASIKDILIISTPEDIGLYKKIFGDGSHLGLNLEYVMQPSPNGLAEAFILGEGFINKQKVALILGDNFFYGSNFSSILMQAKDNPGGTVFLYSIENPSAYGVAELNKNNKIVSIEEKPTTPKSNLAVTGLYFYDENVVEYAKSLSPSSRGELEITDLNRIYIENQSLNHIDLGRGFMWMDAGSFDTLQSVGNFVAATQQRQGSQIACIEEIALKNKWINLDQLKDLIKYNGNSEYTSYLKKLIIKEM